MFLSPTPADRQPNQETFPLQAVNGAAIRTHGQRSTTLDLSLRRIFHWVFYVTAVQHPILGINFLCFSGQLVDLRQNRLLDAEMHISIQGISCHLSSLSPVLSHPTTASPLTTLLDEFPNNFTSPTTAKPIKHTITHHIEKTGPLVFAKQRCLPPDHLQIAKQEFEQVMDLYYICPSSSSYLHFIWCPKKLGIGVLVETTRPSTRSLYLTNIPSLIFKTSSECFKGPPVSAEST